MNITLGNAAYWVVGVGAIIYILCAIWTYCLSPKTWYKRLVKLIKIAGFVLVCFGGYTLYLMYGT